MLRSAPPSPWLGSWSLGGEEGLTEVARSIYVDPQQWPSACPCPVSIPTGIRTPFILCSHKESNPLNLSQTQDKEQWVLSIINQEDRPSLSSNITLMLLWFFLEIDQINPFTWMYKDLMICVLLILGYCAIFKGTTWEWFPKIFRMERHTPKRRLRLLQPRVLGNKFTQKDNADSGVQFITPAGPRQSLLLAKDPDWLLWKFYIP